jgi:hypothetical protein
MLYVFTTLLLMLLGVVFAQDATAAPKFDIWAILRGIWEFVAGNPAIAAPIVAYILTLVPGPFRGIVEAIINGLLEQITKRRTEDAVKATYDEFKERLERPMSEERKQQVNNEALKRATELAVALGEPKEQAEQRVRAAFRTLKAAGEVK